MPIQFLNGSDHNGQRAQNAADPTADQDLATKKYVDGKAAGGGGGALPYALLPAVGSWFVDPVIGGTGSIQQSEQELDVTARFLAGGTWDAVAVQVTGAGTTGAVFRVAIYSDVNGVPGALLAQSAAIDATTTGVKTVTLTAAFSVPSSGAIIWAGLVVQGGASTRPTFIRNNVGYPLGNRTAAAPTDLTSAANPNYYVGGVSAAPPTTWTSTNRFDSAPRFAYRRSA